MRGAEAAGRLAVVRRRQLRLAVTHMAVGRPVWKLVYCCLPLLASALHAPPQTPTPRVRYVERLPYCGRCSIAAGRGRALLRAHPDHVVRRQGARHVLGYVQGWDCLQMAQILHIRSCPTSNRGSGRPASPPPWEQCCPPVAGAQLPEPWKT